MEVRNSRTSLLEEILDIEAEIKKIRWDPTYMKIVHNLKRLRGRSFGNPVMTIASPDDLNSGLRVRRHSKEMKVILRRYGEWRREYEEKIDKLHKRKRSLEKELFR